MNVRVSNLLDDIAGGPGLGAAEYVDLCLALANWRPADGLKWLVTISSVLLTADARWLRALGRTSQSLRMIGPDLRERNLDQHDDLVKGGLALQRRLVSVLTVFRQGPEATLAKFRVAANAACQSITVRTTLRVMPDGTLEHVHRYIPGDHEGVKGLLMAFLLDPDRPAGGQLRTCRLTGCDTFFIARKKPVRGGRVCIYCSVEHQQEADRILGRQRAKRQRERKRHRRGAEMRGNVAKV